MLTGLATGALAFGAYFGLGELLPHAPRWGLALIATLIAGLAAAGGRAIVSAMVAEEYGDPEL